MKLEDHVLLAIDAFGRNEKDHALLHACFAIEATSKKLFIDNKPGKLVYKKCIKQYWWILERFIGEGLNLEDTRFTHLKLDNGYGKIIESPDLADVVYHIFRCNHAHANEVPIEFALMPSEPGCYTWIFDRVKNSLNMPDMIIWSLLAISVFCHKNSDIHTSSDAYLKWGDPCRGYETFLIKDYWGKEVEVKRFFSDKPCTRIKIENL